MNKKEEARAQLAALEQWRAALLQVIEAPDEAVEKKPLLDHSFAAELVYPANRLLESRVSKAYEEAINTLLDLRRQPGSEAPIDGKRQWFINGAGHAVSRFGNEYKICMVCPPFGTQESAEAARDVVGLDRVLRMYNTLHGRYE